MYNSTKSLWPQHRTGLDYRPDGFIRWVFVWDERTFQSPKPSVKDVIKPVIKCTHTHTHTHTHESVFNYSFICNLFFQVQVKFHYLREAFPLVRKARSLLCFGMYCADLLAFVLGWWMCHVDVMDTYLQEMNRENYGPAVPQARKLMSRMST